MKFSCQIKNVLITVLLFCAVRASAQKLETDTTTYSNGINDAVSLYHAFTFPSPGLYNGSQYMEYAYTLKEGSPFFIFENFIAGSVFYNGILYEHVPMLYDVLKGEVIIHDPAEVYKVSLLSEKIGWFSLSNHTFVRFEQNNSDKQLLATGFYDVLYNGNINLYEKVNEKIEESISSAGVLNRYISEVDLYYLQKDNKFYEVNNKRDVLSLLKNKKKEIQQFIRKNKLNLRKAKTFALTRIVAYYDSINK